MKPGADAFAVERDQSLPHLAASLLGAAMVAGLAVGVILVMLPVLALGGLGWLVRRRFGQLRAWQSAAAAFRGAHAGGGPRAPATSACGRGAPLSRQAAGEAGR